MTDPLPDDQVDQITFEPLDVPAPPRALVAVRGAEPWPALSILFDFQDWPHLRYYARALTHANGGSYDEVGFAYDTDDQWPEDEAFTGVRVDSPFDDEDVLSRAAFERLMARYYAALVDAAARTHDPAVDEPWWDEITGAARALGERSGAA